MCAKRGGCGNFKEHHAALNCDFVRIFIFRIFAKNSSTTFIILVKYNYIMRRFSSMDRLYMERALQLARCGVGSTSPNPMVGAVIVNNGRIIGEGFHLRAGEPHAEVNAVNSVKECDRHLIEGAVMYVTLEPCSHYGKTPPCCDLIIARRMARVVIATTDFNANVNGEGIRRMRASGIQVDVGLLEQESRRLNDAFFAFHQKKRPYITLKWAQSSDGFIDCVRGCEEKPLRVSNGVSQVAVHKLRAAHDAILVGTRTALLDNPSLNVRCWAGRAPLRLVVDRKGVLPISLSLFDGSCPTVVFTGNTASEFGKKVEHVILDSSKDSVRQIVDVLYSRNIGSLLVEGGAALLQSFIDAGLWDSARIEVNPSVVAGGGVAAPTLAGCVKVSEENHCGNIISLFERL